MKKWLICLFAFCIAVSSLTACGDSSELDALDSLSSSDSGEVPQEETNPPETEPETLPQTEPETELETESKTEPETEAETIDDSSRLESAEIENLFVELKSAAKSGDKLSFMKYLMPDKLVSVLIENYNTNENAAQMVDMYMNETENFASLADGTVISTRDMSEEDLLFIEKYESKTIHTFQIVADPDAIAKVRENEREYNKTIGDDLSLIETIVNVEKGKFVTIELNGSAQEIPIYKIAGENWKICAEYQGYIENYGSIPEIDPSACQIADIQYLFEDLHTAAAAGDKETFISRILPNEVVPAVIDGYGKDETLTSFVDDLMALEEDESLKILAEEPIAYIENLDAEENEKLIKLESKMYYYMKALTDEEFLNSLDQDEDLYASTIGDDLSLIQPAFTVEDVKLANWKAADGFTNLPVYKINGQDWKLAAGYLSFK